MYYYTVDTHIVQFVVFALRGCECDTEDYSDCQSSLESFSVNHFSGINDIFRECLFEFNRKELFTKLENTI